MSNNLLAVPIALPMLTAILLLIFKDRLRVQRVIAIASTGTGFIVSLILFGVVRGQGIQTLYVGGFPAPFGIVLVADLFGALMVILSGLIGIAVLIYTVLTIDRERETHFFHPIFQFLLMGVNGAFLTGDLFNLFVWFEVMLIASYILVSLGGEPYQLREGFKYVLINVLTSSLFLVGIAVLYGVFGTVNMADLAHKVSLVGDAGGITTVIAITFLVVFGIKAAIFPLYYWLPTAYYAPPTAVTAVFAALLTKVGVYSLVRIFTLIFTHDTALTKGLLAWIAGITMVFGVLGAIAPMDFKRILAYHSISQIGYMIMGLAIFTPLALAGAIYYIFHHSIVKGSLFLSSGIAEGLTGSTRLNRMGGLLITHPGLAGLFLVAGLSLAGVPPLSGFFGKFLLVREGFAEGNFLLVGTAIGVGIFTLYSMIKIFRIGFWGEASLAGGEGAIERPHYHKLLGSLGMLLVFTVVIGLFAGPFVEIALESADQMLNPMLYIEAVLGPAVIAAQ